ncbi:MAG: membrane protein insertion efficiency factor YidD [Clostridia bacterium]|nr:membrane protein insertion efficiency factor YidD [Clostridia bacterium]
MKKQFREVRTLDLVTYAVLPPVLTVLLWALGIPAAVEYIPIQGWIFYTLGGITTYFFVKRFVIGVVLCYKAFAPLKVRDRCRFQPTCSTYMIMAIKKYGLIYGIIKGIRRITRCHPPNGGEDYP